MTVSIHPGEEADLENLAKLNAESKLALVINRLLWKEWPNHEGQSAICQRTIVGTLKDPAQTLIKAVDDESGELLGWLAWSRRAPGVDSNADKAQECPEGLKPKVFHTVIESVNMIAKETEHLDRLEQTFIVVKPGQRGKGIGTQLMNVLLDKAKAEKLPVVSQAEPAAYDFFKKLGFQDTKHVDWDLSQWAVPRSGFGPFRLAGMAWYP